MTSDPIADMLTRVRNVIWWPATLKWTCWPPG